MAFVQFGKDRNWEGYIGIEYSYSQSVAAKQTTVTIDSIRFQSIEGRSCTWTAWGYIYFTASSGGQDYVSYSAKNVYTSGPGWATLDSYPGASIVVNHDSNGNGYFTITLQPYGSYNDFNVFHPSGGSYNCEYSGGTNLTVSLPQIDSSGPTITLTASVDALNNVTLSATSDVACSNWKYQVDGGFTWTSMDTSTSTTASATIPNMSGAHTFVVRATKTSNGVTGSSNAVSTDTPAVSWDSNVATTDGSIALTMSNVPLNAVVKVKYGSTELWSYTWSTTSTSGTATFAAASLKQWFTTAGVTTLQSITITAVIEGYSLATASFTLTAGNNMKPLVLQPTPSIVQPERIQQTFPNTWIANVSKAKVSVPAEAGSNAAISSVTVSYGSETMTLTYDSTSGRYEGTTSKPITGNTVFTATVTDQRGMTAQSSYSLTGVQAYTKPTVTIDSAGTYRSDSSGNEQSGGPCVRVKATAAYDTGISGNTLEAFYFYVSEDGSSTTHNLTSGAQSAAFALLSPRPDNAITIVVVAQDKISNEVYARSTLSGAHRDVILARYFGKTVVGVGQVPNVLRDSTGAFADGIDVEEKGGYYVEGRDTINYEGCNRNVLQTQDSRWSNDLLAVDLLNAKAVQNETTEFVISSNNLSKWTNLPPAIASSSPGTFSGVRTVIVGGWWVWVVILERLPVRGRIWSNMHYKATNSAYTWSGWVGHTPDIT